MADWWKIGGAMAAQDAANQARRTASQSKETNKLLAEQNRLLKMTEAERVAERQAEEIMAENSRTKWTLITIAVLFIGACIAFPVFGIIVLIVVVGIIIYLIVARIRFKRKYDKSGSVSSKKK